MNYNWPTKVCCEPPNIVLNFILIREKKMLFNFNCGNLISLSHFSVCRGEKSKKKIKMKTERKN